MLYKKSLYFVLGFIIIIALSVVYYKFNPAKYGFFPQCPFHKFTGLDCPGCGSQRSIHALLHGDFKAAAGYNLLLIISIPFLSVHFYYKLKSFFIKREISWEVIYHPLTPKIIFVIVMVFWITRNIPVTPFSYLAAGR
jgi:hypothetical protein